MSSNSKISHRKVKSENLVSYKYELDNQINNSEEGFILSNSLRYSIYILFSFVNIVVNMDSGNIPAATIQIRNDLKINDKMLGLFSSLISFGTLIGGIISFSIINIVSRKWTLIVTCIGIVACLFTFPMTDNLGLLFTNRIICGIFMVNFLISLFYRFSFLSGLINLVLKRLSLL